MGIRAHRVDVMKYAANSTFSYHDDDLIDRIFDAEGTIDGRNWEGYGIVEIRVEALEEALVAEGIELDEGVRQNLKGDIAWAKANGRSGVMYDCF
jgi:hypothetical protein